MFLGSPSAQLAKLSSKEKGEESDQTKFPSESLLSPIQRFACLEIPFVKSSSSELAILASLAPMTSHALPASVQFLRSETPMKHLEPCIEKLEFGHE